MWYFAWILGLPLAAAFAVLNAMWFELMEDEATRHDRFDPAGPVRAEPDHGRAQSVAPTRRNSPG